MSYYEVLLFLHVLAAIVWIGGGLALQLVGIRAEQMRNGPVILDLFAALTVAAVALGAWTLRSPAADERSQLKPS